MVVAVTGHPTDEGRADAKAFPNPTGVAIILRGLSTRRGEHSPHVGGGIMREW
jgi:hypothetical protein